ncbi:DUF3718 domain-containing protein [Lysobacter sp. N42]|uniref:DUF3718 domain-containing protein n=1 Tax=Lysobacter sp. N42 TaxID=2545719 RepID=UPI00140435B0|nr:DUF3718 domain-containing protein [Lysobacter sp. N42]
MIAILGAALIGNIAISTPAQASAAIAESLCTAVSADDRQRFRTILDNHNVRLRNVYSGVRCNGYSMIQFAITAEAASVGELLIRQLPSRSIEEDTVNGVPVLEWAAQSGYSNSPVVSVVRERLAG